MKKTRRAALLFFILIGPFYAAFAAQKPELVRVAYFPEWPTANLVAKSEKWYDQESGVTFDWRTFNSGTEMAAAMAAGEIDISYSIGFVPFLVAVSAGNPIKVVGVAVSYSENDNCVVHSKAAIDRANAHELQGKKVAIPLGTVTHYKLLRTLEALAVDTAQVELIDMVSTDAAKALEAEKVTMACGWGGALRRMQSYGRVLMTAAEQDRLGIRVFDVIAVTNNFLEKYPGLVTSFLQVTDRSSRHLRDNLKTAKPVIAEAASMEIKESDVVLSLFHFPERKEQLSEEWLNGGVQKLMKEAGVFYVKHGQMPQTLEDYGAAVDATFYRAVE